MKGGLAGLVVALEALARREVPGRVVLALVADEEGASLGCEAMIREFAAEGITGDVCLVAEPTWLAFAVTHRGYAVVRVHLPGRAAHSSQPEQGVNATAHLGRLLVAVEEADGRLGAGTPHPLVGAAPPRRIGAPYWMESALWEEAGVPAVVCGPADGGLHATDEWVEVDQVRAFPQAVSDAVEHFLRGK